jgi:hypothetical protein
MIQTKLINNVVSVEPFAAETSGNMVGKFTFDDV